MKKLALPMDASVGQSKLFAVYSISSRIFFRYKNHLPVRRSASFLFRGTASILSVRERIEKLPGIFLKIDPPPFSRPVHR